MFYTEYTSYPHVVSIKKTLVFSKGLFEARVGFEPTNDSFANCSVRPLHHRALIHY